MNNIGIKLIVFVGVFICSCYVLVASQLDKNGNESTDVEREAYQQETQENQRCSISGNFDFSREYLTDNQLRNLSKTELMLLRNEIFAHHGYIFQREDLKNYFSQFDWYRPQYKDVSSKLNKVELYNIDKIKQYE